MIFKKFIVKCNECGSNDIIIDGDYESLICSDCRNTEECRIID